MAVGMSVVARNSVPSAHPVHNLAELTVPDFAQWTRRNPSDPVQDLWGAVVGGVDLQSSFVVQLLRQARLLVLWIVLAFRSSLLLAVPSIAVG